MPDISKFVTLNITRDTVTIKRVGFGKAGVVAYHTENTDTHRHYSELSELTDDGFAVSHAAYRKVAAAFAQNPRPEEVMLIRLPVAPVFRWTFTITDATEGHKIQLLVVLPNGDEQTVDYTVLAAATTSTVATAVAAIIHAYTGVAASAVGAVITVSPEVVGERFWLANPLGGDILETTADADYDDLLSAQLLIDDSFFFVHIDSDSKANVDKVAAWAAANDRMFFTSTNASNQLSGTGTLGTDLKNAANENVVLLWTPETHDSGDAALAAIGGANDPGSITFCHQTLEGVTAKTLTTTQTNNLEAQNINWYQPMPAGNRTAQGVVASGEFIDIIHGTYALTQRIKEDQYLAIATNKKKLPYTDKGIEKLLTALQGSLHAFVGTDGAPGLLVGSSIKVWATPVKDMDSQKKRQRVYDKLFFYCEYEGAVHKGGINGTVAI